MSNDMMRQLLTQKKKVLGTKYWEQHSIQNIETKYWEQHSIQNIETKC